MFLERIEQGHRDMSVEGPIYHGGTAAEPSTWLEDPVCWVSSFKFLSPTGCPCLQNDRLALLIRKYAWGVKTFTRTQVFKRKIHGTKVLITASNRSVMKLQRSARQHHLF